MVALAGLELHWPLYSVAMGAIDTIVYGGISTLVNGFASSQIDGLTSPLASGTKQLPFFPIYKTPVAFMTSEINLHTWEHGMHHSSLLHLALLISRARLARIASGISS